MTGDSTFFARFQGAPEVMVIVDADDGAGSVPTGKGAGKYVAGTITGAGRYQAGKKVVLKASSNKGYVFAGWSGADGTFLTKAATWTIPAMGGSDVEYIARYVTSAQDLDSIRLAVGDGELDPGATAKWTVRCGVALEWPVAATALSETTVKASGLPSGLKLVQDKATKAYSVKGAPTAASKLNTKTGEYTPAKVKFTVTTAGKSKREFNVEMTVLPLPAWMAGAFTGMAFAETGAATAGIVQSLAVAANGKISGKLLEGGRTWTLAAASFSRYDEETGSYVAEIVGKSGKALATNVVAFAAAEVRPDGGAAVQCGVAECDEWMAWQNLWKRADTKARMPNFKKSVAVELEGGLKLTFKKDGAVSFAGKAGGAAVSGASQLVPDGNGEWLLPLYAPPKGASGGFCDVLAARLTVDDKNTVTAVEVFAVDTADLER